MFSRAALYPTIILLLAACEPPLEPAAEYASAEEQLAAEYGADVDLGAVATVLQLSREMVLKHRSAGISAMVTALKDLLSRRGLDASYLDSIQDFALGEPLPGVGDYFESPASSNRISNSTHALGVPTSVNAKYYDCPPMQTQGQGMSCAEMVDSVVVKVRNEVPTQSIQQQVEQQVQQEPLLAQQPQEFRDYVMQYLVGLMLSVRNFGIDVAAIRGEYTMREAAACDQTQVDGAEIARMRGIDESVTILRQIIGRGELVLAPQGGDCLKIGPTGAQTQHRIDRAVDKWIDENMLCEDMNRENPLVQQAEQARREGIERGIRAHTTTIWVGVIRRGIRKRGKEFTVACVDGCQPKDQATYTTSPLVIDLEGDGLELTTDRVSFDLRATGQRQSITWAGRSEGLLALDLDGDGRITSGRELFGDRSQCGAERCADGAAALGFYDHERQGGNGDGRVDAGDAVFSKLLVWVDSNQDGKSQPDELESLAARGIQGFSLQAAYFDEHVPAGRISLSLSVDTESGSRAAYDVWFKNLASPGFPIPLQ